ncbi:MAG: glutathione S-transferase N-terminal domain-containing protein, partial [Pseudomonadota bacterium]
RHAKASPFVRKVMVALEELGKTGAVTLEDGASSPLAPNPGNVEASPLGKIPALILDDGTTLYDSRVITRFLDAEHGGGLYPAGGPALWDCLVREATADGVMEAALAVVYEGRLREEGQRSEAWVAGQRAKIARAMDLYDADIERLSGKTDMGALALACALGYVDFRLTDWDWRQGRPKLAAWADEIFARPSLAATAPS